MEGKTHTAIIVAGGTGTRMKTGSPGLPGDPKLPGMPDVPGMRGVPGMQSVPKQFLPLSGKPVMVHTLRQFLDFDTSLKIVLVIHPETQELWDSIASVYFTQLEKSRIDTVHGGASRTISVYNGIRSLLDQTENPNECLVAIHDAVRPCLTNDMLIAAYEMAAAKGSAVCCVPVKSSMRMQLESGETQAVDRSRFFHVQTPQVFTLDAIAESYRDRPHDDFTDDATLFEKMGGNVHICAGSYNNIKLTTPEDMAVAEQILLTETQGNADERI